MKIYLVGGAVRDALLKKEIKERDWVVVGSTPEEMIEKGFRPVGKDFPVFLHPKTHEEYALARTERKTAKGYKGFHFYTAPDVTLEEDLIRRDLTINAMAQDVETGAIIDPFYGQKDLVKKILRHVSPAFEEDPVRILRLARFAAQFPDFSIDEKTNELMQRMVHIGEVDALVAERIWKEFSRALIAEKPTRFFEVLKNCDALPVLFPDFKHAALPLSVLEKAIEGSSQGTVRFAALLYSLSANDIQALCKRFRAPSEFSELALLVSKFHEKYAQLDEKNAEQLLFILKNIDAFRRAERFSEWIKACYAIYPEIHHEKILLRALAAAKNIDIQVLVKQKLQGEKMAEAIYQLQLSAIQNILHQRNELI